MTMLRTSVVLADETYALTWMSEGFDVQHEALFVPLDTSDMSRLAQATVRAGQELSQAGLFDSEHGVHPDLLETFRALAKPAVEFFGWIGDRQRPKPVSALATTTSTRGVLAVLNGDTLGLHPVRHDALADALVAQLPAAPAGHGQSITVPASEIDGTARSVGGDEEFSVFAGQQRNPAVQQLRRLVGLPRTSGAQLYVAVRDRLGRRHRCPFPLNVIDTDAGRWFVQRQHNAGGQAWLTAAPATPQVLSAKLYEMHSALIGGR
ncbi:ESX secretion-associated protein EspG [Kutzneria buriramensis]|uniref:ESAT-6 protein secretion system EspG family protein n=1 Tax=Kutzneria buriramensis TaxID=1045776 RepID=A0A3E0H0Z7_9PSEU|nr:ESX secretion-associated protein EspG [Kutzneria buriramensis]REH35729.1 ESAT-6 protein secretion system EspG family protein [Kutzneria buriramensis]